MQLQSIQRARSSLLAHRLVGFAVIGCLEIFQRARVEGCIPGTEHRIHLCFGDLGTTQPEMLRTRPYPLARRHTRDRVIVTQFPV
jgi:hypothetical protein